MDVNGVLASLCFASWPGIAGQFFVASDDHEFAAAMIRAYNDWHIEEWCGAYPGRFIPLAISGFPLGGEWMAEEIRRVADQGLLTPCRCIPRPTGPDFPTITATSGTRPGRRARKRARSWCSTLAAPRTSCPARLST